ncbi:hypothetical protein ADMFC3_23530 [Geovibrio sp. ADMFC3]
MDLEKSITNAVSAALADRYIHPIPVFANREDCAKILGMSPVSLDRLLDEGVLEFDRHTTQHKKKGRTMYYMPEILKTLQPSKATIRLFGDQSKQ